MACRGKIIIGQRLDIVLSVSGDARPTPLGGRLMRAENAR